MDADRDADDWAQALAGDGDAFGRVFDRRERQVRRQAARLLRSADDVEDAVAIVFLEAWRRRLAVPLVDGSVLPWLLVTTTNVANNLRRSSRRHHALLAHLPAPEPAPDPTAESDEGDVLTALRQLSLADQQVLTLCVLEQWSEREVAVALNVRPGTVKSRLSRAKQRLAGRVALVSSDLHSITNAERPTHGI